MQTYNLADYANLIQNSSLDYFDLNSISHQLNVSSDRNLFNIISKLIKAKIIEKIERDKYVKVNLTGNIFGLANFCYQPSYVSFESALSHYGVISQFPTETTSVTTKISKAKIVLNQNLSYSQLKPSLFWGYLKNSDGILIAEPEKALIDQVYLASKGIKNTNFDEYDFSIIIKTVVLQYAKKFPQTKKFSKLLTELQGYL